MFDRPGIVLGVAALVLNEGATDERARDVVRAAVEAGAVAIDTARAYARVDDDSVGERVAVAGREARPEVPIITKAGHYRVSASAWNTDGGEQRLRADAALSAEVLGAPLDLLLLHRADRVDDLDDSVRTLAALRDEGVARAIGLSNASLEVLQQASSLTRIDAVQNRLGLGVDAFAEYRHCHEAGISFMAYAPFGGPRAAPLATRVPRVAALAANRGSSVHRAALAAMLDLLPGLWPVIGATRVESVRDAMAAVDDVVDDELRGALTDDLASRGVAI
ncbi:MAG: aldo/keto reductase [Microcella sp.]|uniref:aldo/keto reductase n=1 Tax=Microcella sp. TaxID=1913979 RepID=UPI0024CC5E6B|nr:aldo/keto reductase [Microcella sp.]UYN83182.1 MAG: aldo/keto reductase [Microcella sp.]